MTRSLIVLIVLSSMMTLVIVQASPGSLTLPQRRQLFAEGVRYFDQQDYAKAIANLTQLVDDYPELRDYALYFLARAYLKLPDSARALTTFQTFLTENPTHPLTDEVSFTTAHLLLNAKRYAEAIPLYTRVINRPGIEQGELYYRLGQAYQASNRLSEAISAYHQMVSFYPGHSSRKQAEQHLQALLKTHPQLITPQWTEETLWKHAQALFDARLYTSALAQYTQFLSQYSQSSYAIECQFRMADAYFRSGQAAKGTAALEELVRHNATQQPDIAARALYAIGSRHWNANRDAQAKTTLQQVLKDYSQTSWGANASYVLGRLAQNAKAYSEAAQWYLAVFTKYSTHTLAEEAFWRAGWMYFLGKQYPQALQIFSQGMAAFPKGTYYEAHWYWQGRTQEQLKHVKAAATTYKQLVQSVPNSYYGMLAQERLRVLKVKLPRPKQKTVTPPEFWSVFDDLRARLAPACYQMIAPHIAKAIELQHVQLPQYATKELDGMVTLLNAEDNKFVAPTNTTDDLRLLYFLSRLSAVAGDYLKAIQFANKLEARLDESTLAVVPYDLSTLKFPLAYWDLIQTYAMANTLDPFLVAAVIRQESAYNPKAVSGADARGLMQLIPETGRRTAKRVGLNTFTTAQLYDPAINIQLGTAYLAGLLEQSKGDLYRALAGYNAGPNATNKWWPPPEATPVDPEIIVENIAYPATRDYVKLVLRSQHEYRRIYASSQQ